MWALAMTEELSNDKSTYVLLSMCDWRSAKDKILTYMSAAVGLINLGVTQNLWDACSTQLQSLLDDGDRLASMDTESEWSGFASTCPEHQYQRTFTYWIRRMSEEDFNETKRLFEVAFPGGNAAHSHSPSPPIQLGDLS